MEDFGVNRWQRCIEGVAILASEREARREGAKE